MKKRIYDAVFAAHTGNNHPTHIAKYWWVSSTQSGTWTPAEAYDYVIDNPDTVYVARNGHEVYVLPYRHTNNPSSRWIQTRRDETSEDNLVTLAQRHAQGLVNN